MAWAAHNSSMANTFLKFSIIFLSFKAAPMPILTWSSLFPEVGMESTEAGWEKTLHSEVRAAAVTCSIMNPEFKPGLAVKNGGKSPYSA